MKQKKTIDDVFEMSDSRYSLVNAISRKAREIADEAELNHDMLYRKPVNMVIDRLLDGRAIIEHIDPPAEEAAVPQVSPFDAGNPELPTGEAAMPVFTDVLPTPDED